jgi:transposase-like protein
MQILQRCNGSIQQYLQEISDPDHYRPGNCPQCQAKSPLNAHGFYSRTLVDVGFDDSVHVRRYLCLLCRRTVSLLPELALPYLRSSVSVIGSFLAACLLQGRTLREAARAASQPAMPYQRGQFWIRRFRKQAAALCAALVVLTAVLPASDFPTRALRMLTAIGWIAAHRFLFVELRMHLLGWPRSLVPDGRRVRVPAAPSSS